MRPPNPHLRAIKHPPRDILPNQAVSFRNSNLCGTRQRHLEIPICVVDHPFWE